MKDHREPAQDGVRAPRPSHAGRAEAGQAPSRRTEVARGEMAGMDLGMRVLSYLIAGVLVYGGLGWLGDHLLGTGFLLPIGIVLGAAGGCYVIIRRYGRVPSDEAASSGREAARHDQSTTKNTTEGAR